MSLLGVTSGIRETEVSWYLAEHQAQDLSKLNRINENLSTPSAYFSTLAKTGAPRSVILQRCYLFVAKLLHGTDF